MITGAERVVRNAGCICYAKPTEVENIVAGMVYAYLQPDLYEIDELDGYSEIVQSAVESESVASY